MSSHVIDRLINRTLVAFVALALRALSADAQVIVPVTPANQLSVGVSTAVTYDSTSKLYAYDYTLTNASTSVQAAWFFALQFNGPGDSPLAPVGWTFAQHDDRPIVSWAATDTGPLPPDFVDDGNVPPSVYTIAPGATLSGFRLVSPSPPGTVQFFAQGETKLAQVLTDVGDLPLEGEEVLDFTEDSITGAAVGPVPVDPAQVFAGGRRPAVDTFLVFLNLANGDVRNAPVGIVIRFGINGETVSQTTFHATLNGTDVTASFVAGSQAGELVGLFGVGSSPLQTGKNVLITSVDGIVPGTTRTATDVDRVTFTVQP
ncbi:MAG TPA: hypothetical protein VFP91_02810 [Vicinamibacterales bacterium]|nr:hypothetical protein [Vicinamibacterales bacterium]